MKKTAIFNKALDVIAAGVMIYFSIPKLTGAKAAVEGFKQFESAIPLDPDTFRIFSGFAELVIAALLLIFVFSGKESVGKLAYTVLLVTMISALILEFFVRPAPEVPLAIVAILLAILSVVKLKKLL